MWAACPHGAEDYIPALNEARYWAGKMKMENADLLHTRELLKANLDSYHAENAELRRQLEVAREALEHYRNRYNLVHELPDVARDALAKMDGDK
jgi:hypothetical protein